MIPHVHMCCVCGFHWGCDGVGRGKTCEVLKAVKVNKTGPYCELCRNGIVFIRLLQNRGIKPDIMIKTLQQHEQEMICLPPRGRLLT